MCKQNIRLKSKAEIIDEITTCDFINFTQGELITVHMTWI